MYDYINALILSFLPDRDREEDDFFTIYYVPHYVYNKIYRYKEYRIYLDCIQPKKRTNDRTKRTNITQRINN